MMLEPLIVDAIDIRNVIREADEGAVEMRAKRLITGK